MITFLPPLSRAAYDALMARDGEFRFRREINQFLGVASNFHFDLIEGNLYESNDCEFIDGFHGGHVTYARILLYMRRAGVHNLNVMANELEKIISENSGRAAIPGPHLGSDREIDFLKIGCKKAVKEKVGGFHESRAFSGFVFS